MRIRCNAQEQSWRCDVAQVSATQALEQIVGRQATVDAVEAQVKRSFEVAERTARDVRFIESERREVEGTRALLDDYDAATAVRDAA